MSKTFSGFCAVAIIAVMASCSGRTQENMVPSGDTVEVAGGETVADGNDTVVTDGSTAVTNAPAAQDSDSVQ